MSKRHLSITLALGAVVVTVWLWQIVDARGQSRIHEEAFRRLGSAVLAAAEGALLGECRGGTVDREELALTLEDVRARIDADFLGVFAADGGALAVAGGRGDAAGEGIAFERFESRLEPRGGRGLGRGRGRRRPFGEPLPDGPLLVVLEYPRTSLEEALRSDRNRYLLTGGALTLLAIAVLLVLNQRLRAAELRADLALSRARVEGLEFLGRLGAGLVHETKNPLSVVRGLAEHLRGHSGDADDEVQTTVGRILEETDRTVARLDEFLLLSRPARLRREPVELRALGEELVALVRPELQAKGAEVAVEGPPLEVEADREQVRRLLMNLLLNADEAVGAGGQVLVGVMPTRGGRARLMVEDDGDGVPEEIRDTLFEPYVTGRAGGTGLGLSIARRIAVEHGWELTYEPRPDGGTRMIVEIPDGG